MTGARGANVIERLMNTLDVDLLDRICKLTVFIFLIWAFIRGFFLGKITDDTFSNVVLIVIGFYFGRSTPSHTEKAALSRLTNGPAPSAPPAPKETTP
jgi:hypothetical protein